MMVGRITPLNLGADERPPLEVTVAHPREHVVMVVGGMRAVLAPAAARDLADELILASVNADLAARRADRAALQEVSNA